MAGCHEYKAAVGPDSDCAQEARAATRSIALISTTCRIGFNGYKPRHSSDTNESARRLMTCKMRDTDAFLPKKLACRFYMRGDPPMSQLGGLVSRVSTIERRLKTSD